MSASELHNELSLAARRLQSALKLERQLKKANGNRQRLPNEEECRLLVNLRAMEYALHLSRYRESVERRLLARRAPRIGASIRKRMELRASRTGAGNRKT